MPDKIYIGNIPLSFSRKNIKNINLRISKPDGEIKLSAPLFTSMKTIEKFVISKQDWIIKTQTQIKENNKRYKYIEKNDEFKFQTGDKISVWGKQYTLEVLPSTRWSLSLNDRNSRANFFTTENSDSEKRKQYIQKWYKQELLEKSKAIFEKWHQVTGLKPKEVSARFTKTVWGTCNKQKQKIMLNAQLATRDIKFLDYVILHELTHLKYSNHGNNFKQFMTEHMPNWTDIKKQLND